MQINPTSSGGRVVQDDTPFGRFRVEWDAHGTLISETLEIREPETRANTPCIHRGEYVTDIACESCKGKVTLKVYRCTKHETCTMDKRHKEVPGCCDAKCKDYEPKKQIN